MFETSARCMISIANIGFIGTWKVIFWKIGGKSDLRRVHIRKLDRSFYYRGKNDHGALTHFYIGGVKINEGSSSDKIKTIIDAGANIGTEMLRFRHFHPDAKIIAIEGNEQNFEVLKMNIGSDNNTKPTLAALHNKSAKLKSYNPTSNNESFRFLEAKEGEAYDVLGVSLENIIIEHGIHEIDILKCDIEGSERYLFDDSCETWVGKVKVIIMECPDADAEGTTAQVFKSLEANHWKFNTHIVGENLVLIRDDLSWTVEKSFYL